MVVRLLSICLLLLSAELTAAPYWRDAGTASADQMGRRLVLDYDVLNTSLLSATKSTPVIIDLPMPDGSLRAFEVWLSPVMEPALAARYPQIRSYKAYAVDDNSVSARLSTDPGGLHAYISQHDATVLIDPDSDTGAGRYISYTHRAYTKAHRNQRQYARCAVTDSPMYRQTSITSSLLDDRLPKSLIYNQPQAKTEGGLRQYRLAAVATSGYSAAVAGGNPANTLAAINVAITRVNQVYETDVGVQLLLVADNDQLIFTSEPDGFTEFDLSAQLDEVQPVIDGIIGSANYDIGHVFSEAFGGLAFLGVACDDAFKARGASGRSDRTGDAFYIDLLAHELGHQFNADHSFNGTTESCGFSRNAATAFEPGSGVTIMSYSGICGAEDVSQNSEPTFHPGSIVQIVDFTRTGTGATCATMGANAGNTAPVVDAGADYTIPADTPFRLTGSATDPDGDTLKYRWDEYDNSGQGIAATTSCTYGKDLGSNPLFRSYAADGSAERTFPALATLNSNTVDPAEKLPLIARDINFRFTSLDGKGGVGEDDMSVTVADTTGPFELLQPDGGETLDSTLDHTVEWHTACTEQAPVNCATVDIQLSTDGGATYSNVLAATPNDGVAIVNFGSVSSSTARLRAACSSNIFFDISDQDFSLSPSAGVQLVATGNGGTGSCGTTEVNGCVTGTIGADIEPNDSTSTAQPVSLPFVVDGSVHDSTDIDDYFSFVASTGNHDIVLNNFGESDLDLFLLDSDGVTELAVSEDGLATTERIREFLTAGHTYYVRVLGYYTSGLLQNYSLSIIRAPGGGDDDEPNDTAGAAQTISLPFQITGSVQTTLDESDYFSFTASEGSHNVILNNYGGNNLDLNLYDSDGVSLLATSDSSRSRSELVNFDLIAGRIYYIEVVAVDTASLESLYVLTVSKDEGKSSSGAVSLSLLALFTLLIGCSRNISRKR